MYIMMQKQLLTIPQMMPSIPHEQQKKREMNSHPLQNSFCMMSYDMEYPFGQFKSAVLILFPPISYGPLL